MNQIEQHPADPDVAPPAPQTLFRLGFPSRSQILSWETWEISRWLDRREREREFAADGGW